MINRLLLVLGFLIAPYIYADKPPGFLWYNLPTVAKTPKPQRPKGMPFGQLSFQQQDAVLAYYTREAWHKAMNQLTVSNMKNYLALQDYWSQRATKTSRLFEKTMLHYPQYHYETSHPTNNLGVKVADAERERSDELIINSLAKTHGLLYFYRGKNPYDQKQSAVITDFSKHYNMAIIPISVDGAIDPLFPSSRIDKGHAKELGIRFFPALMLVNPKTKKTQPVAYGLITQDMLTRQFFLVATDFAKGNL